MKRFACLSRRIKIWFFKGLFAMIFEITVLFFLIINLLILTPPQL